MRRYLKPALVIAASIAVFCAMFLTTAGPMLELLYVAAVIPGVTGAIMWARRTLGPDVPAWPHAALAWTPALPPLIVAIWGFSIAANGDPLNLLFYLLLPAMIVLPISLISSLTCMKRDRDRRAAAPG